MKKILVSTVALMFGTGLALAQEAPAFADVDTDGNGTISFTELLVAFPDVTEDQFATLDADGSGELDETEFQTHLDELAATGAGAPAADPLPQ